MLKNFEPIRILDQTSDVHVHIVAWMVTNCLWVFIRGMMPKKFTTSQRQYLAQRVKPFVFQEGILYWFGQDNKFHQILQPK